jgi:N6-adenosine-specific RNA methylase IME4
MTPEKYQLLPPLSPEDRASLEASIIAHGVLVPVEYDENGNILDGHHRVAICESLGLVDWPRFIRRGLSEPEKRTLAREFNISRRHLSTSQKQAVIEGQIRDTPSLSARAIAAMLAVDHKTVGAVRERLESTGEIPQLEATTGKDGRERRKPVKTMFLPDRENRKSFLEGAKYLRRQDQEIKHAVRLTHMAGVASKGQITAGQVDQKFPVIYADPPWRFPVYSEITGRNKSAENHYPTMTTEEICGLWEKIGDPAKRDAVLFLWATNPMLLEGLEVMRAWGFKYVHHWIWDKEVAGTGYWGRDRHELLLIGRRGDPATPLPGSQPETVFRAKKTKHSEKPAVFAEQIEAYYPDMPRLEMFCRAPRPGWTAWGFEASEEVSE